MTFIYLSHAWRPANNNLWGVIDWSLWRCCRSLMWVGGFGLLAQRIGVDLCRSLTQRCSDPLSSPCIVWWSVRLHRGWLNCRDNRSVYQARKRRSSKHRREEPQSTRSVYRNPSGLSANRRRAVDDKEGHLIYHDGDILHSRCTQAFCLFVD